ncbi:hypothetical protein BsWGS_08818 [Bradybaena similaris]
MLKMGKTHFVLLVTVLLVDVTQSLSTRSDGKPTKKEEAWKNISVGDYLFRKSLVTWTEAESLCRSYGGKLLELEDRTELTELVKQIFPSDTEEIWIGGIYRDGKWRWASNNTLIVDNLGGKFDNDYDAGDEFCLEVRRANDFNVNDSDCDEIKQFVCEKSR